MSSRGDRVPIYELPELGAHVVGCRRPEEFAVKPENERPLRFAEPDGVLGHRVEHGLQVEGGTADHLQHLARRRLPGEHVGQIAVPRFELLEQADVLDGDDGLVGEGLQQLDLAVGEGPGLGARHPDDADGSAFPQHGYGEAASVTDRAGQRSMLERRVDLEIGYVDHRALEDRPP